MLTMATLFFTLAAVVVGVMMVWVIMRRRSAHESPLPGTRLDNQADDRPQRGTVPVARNQPPSRQKHFYGVSVQPGSYACDAAKQIWGHRYLVEEAPVLPLPDCDRPNCKCYLHPENDRRAGFSRHGDTFAAYGDFIPEVFSQRRKEKTDRREKRENAKSGHADVDPETSGN